MKTFARDFCIALGGAVVVVALIIAAIIYEPPEPVVKIIGEKVSAVENQLVFDFISEQMTNTPTTIYYLISEDGSRVSVSLQQYSHARIGDEWPSNNWQD